MVEMPTESEPVTIHCGDCLDVLRGLPDGCVNAVITDPPYGVGLGTDNDQRTGAGFLGKRGYLNDPDTYESFVADVVPRLNAAIGIARRAAVFSGPHIHEQRKPSAIGGIYHPVACGRTTWGFKTLLPVLFYGVAPDRHKASYSIVLKSTAKTEKNGHPCPKPIEWMRWLVRLATRPGEIVLDPFGGSGTTAVACVAEGRRCILIEKEPAYVEIARRRVNEALGRGKNSLFAGAV